ncbi:GNAT family N-acetyltransferase [Goodfellowiella coeruleoviolacea]|uniref:Acetyltransferase (GNAT) domain-containing protein n=1 Tax=Goodfellowiella coeruleoviolacea TaxID=334858 RepID=A0AAE3GL21_9PSEU|nr:GNAT family N-acetyltransferase [Goodfellowiella coeruleoviolacea]MCP2169593.1 Acetyltransferase (GNAT) domain-containing protein [Goodfellowiella coeruleoviolacea]
MATASVRPATLADVPDIARIQRETWQLAYADLLADQAWHAVDQDSAEQAWQQAVVGPAHVLVALEGAWTVGFCVAGSPAPDSEIASADGSLPADAAQVGLIASLLVEPRWGRRGHGGRLFAAAAEALRADGATRGVVWVPEADQASRAFFGVVDWHPDGVVRTLDAAGRPLREVRLTGGLIPEMTG